MSMRVDSHTSRARRPLLAVASAIFLFGLAAGSVAAATLAYVPNQKSGTISVIDTETDTVTRTLSGGGKLGKRLQAVDADASGSVIYVVDAQRNTLFAIDPATDTVKHSVDIGEDAEGVR